MAAKKSSTKSQSSKSQSSKSQQTDPKKPMAASSNMAARVGPQHELLSQPMSEEISASPLWVQRTPESGSALVQRALRSPSSLSPNAVKSLHRATGSRVASSLLNSRPIAPQASEPKPSASFSLQTKLEVGPARDRYEQEADRTAASVMRQLQATSTVKRSVEPSTAESAEAQRAPLAQSSPETQRAPEIHRAPAVATNRVRLDGESGIGMAGGEVDSSTEQSIQKKRGGGSPLAPKVRSSMEGAFSSDFSTVRVHTDSQSDSLNRSLNARAFTSGSDVFFKRGAYNPGSSDGQKLIAHELTHVVQQGGSTAKRDMVKRDMVKRDTVKRLTVQRTNAKVIQRQLSFDDSWEETSWSGWSGYSKKAAQDKLQKPFLELEEQVAKLKETKPDFEEYIDRTRWKHVQKFVESTKGREITYNEADTLLSQIQSNLEAVRSLVDAPRKPKEEPQSKRSKAKPFSSILIGSSIRNLDDPIMVGGSSMDEFTFRFGKSREEELLTSLRKDQSLFDPMSIMLGEPIFKPPKQEDYFELMRKRLKQKNLDKWKSYDPEMMPPIHSLDYDDPLFDFEQFIDSGHSSKKKEGSEGAKTIQTRPCRGM